MTASRATSALIMVAAVLVAACERTPPTVLEHSAGRSFAGLTAQVHIELDRPYAVVVRYWAEGVDTLEVLADESQRQSVILTGLKSTRRYEYEIRIPDQADPTAAVLASGSFDTSPLHLDLDDLEFTAEGTPSTRLTMLSLAAPRRGPLLSGSSALSNWFAIVDAAGDIVWYMQVPGGAAGWTRLGDGSFVLQSADDGLTVVTAEGLPIASLPQLEMATSTGPGGGGRIHHDVVARSPESVLYLARAEKVVDDTTWVGEQIWEWTPSTGADVLRWDSFDFMDPRVDRGPRSEPGDWLHANSLGLGPDGDVLVSLHYLDQIISIKSDFSEIEWRIGGPGSSFELPADARFSGQHTVAELDPSHVLMFDNGFSRDGAERFSRALELELDFEARAVRKAWEFRPQPDNYSRVISSAHRLANGNTLVTFGSSQGMMELSTGPAEVYEVTPSGDTVWHLVLGAGAQMYRAVPLDAISNETVVATSEGR